MARQQIETSTHVKHDEHRLTIRLSGHVAEKMEFLIDSGQFATKVDFVRTAIERVLATELKKADEKNIHETEFYEGMTNRLQRLKSARKHYNENKNLENTLVHR